MHFSERYFKGVLVLSMFFSFALHIGPLQQDISGIHTWRQSQTMWNIRNFTRHDANIMNPRVAHFNRNDDNLYRYEFPVMQWSIAMLQRVLGEDIRIVRSSIFLIACFGIWFFYQWVQELGLDSIPALASSVLLQFSSLFYLYAVNPIPDVLALSASMAYLFCLFKFFKTRSTILLMLSSFALTLAAASKLPFLMFSMVSIIYIIQNIVRERKISRESVIFIVIHLVFLLPVLLWYAWVMPGWEGNGILRGIFDNKISWDEVRTIIHYHVTTMFPRILMHPYSLILLGIGIFALIKKENKYLVFLSGIISICLLYLILQFNMINTVHDYYMMPFLPILYAGIGFGFQYLWKIRNWVLRSGLAVVVLTSPLIAFNFNKDSWSVKKAYSNPDFINFKEVLKEAVPENERVMLINDRSYFVNTYMIDKMGYVFYNDYLPWNWMEDMILNKSIHYMYSDSRKIDEDPLFQKYIKKEIMEAGSVRVFELKMPD
jgi:hypothetical protein